MDAKKIQVSAASKDKIALLQFRDDFMLNKRWYRKGRITPYKQYLFLLDAKGGKAVDYFYFEHG